MWSQEAMDFFNAYARDVLHAQFLGYSEEGFNIVQLTTCANNEVCICVVCSNIVVISSCCARTYVVLSSISKQCSTSTSLLL